MRGLDSELDDIALGLDLRALHNDHSGFVGPGGIGRTKADEVMPADQQGCGPAHGPDVQGLFHPPDGFFGERLFSGRNLVDVGAGNRVMPRMKVPRSAHEIEDDDIGRQEIVKAPEQQFRGVVHCPLDLDVSNLPQRMHSRVRAPCALHFDIAVKDLSGGAAKLSHDRAGIFLFLPAAVSGTVVFEKEFERRQWIDMGRCSAQRDRPRTSPYCRTRPAANSSISVFMEDSIDVNRNEPPPPKQPPLKERMNVLLESRGNVPTFE